MDAQADGPANIVDGCVKVYVRSFAQAEAAGNATLKDGNKENMTLDNFADWDSQFFITWDEAKATAAGDKLQLKMKVKADKAQTIASQLHKAPGAYVHWYGVGDINVTTEWTEFVSEEVDVVSGDFGEGKIAEDGEEWNTSEVVSHKWGGEEGADEGDKDDAPEKTDDVVVGWTRREDVLTKKADGGNGHEGKLETNIIEIEGIDAQHDEEGECAGIDGHQFAGK
jgi:hypothetical protein